MGWYSYREVLKEVAKPSLTGVRKVNGQELNAMRGEVISTVKLSQKDSNCD